MIVHQITKTAKSSVNLMAEFVGRNYERQNISCVSNYLLIKDMQLVRLTSDIL
jgi:hypothetical protein